MLNVMVEMYAILEMLQSSNLLMEEIKSGTKLKNKIFRSVLRAQMSKE